MFLTVGPYKYEIIARSQRLTDDHGEPCLGLAWPDLGRVEFFSGASPEKRWAVVWHELLHLARADFDIHVGQKAKLSEEAVCNLMGLLMTMISPVDFMRLHVYVAQGIDAPSAMFSPRIGRPIPVMNLTPPRA